MRRLINIRPDGTTFEANESFPISERSSFFVHFFFTVHVSSSETRLVSLSSGNLNDNVSEFISIPRNVICVIGPTIFSGANGTPSELNNDIDFCIAS